MNPVSNQTCVAIVAGEASGDQHGAQLIKAMQEKNPALFFCGIGGTALRQAGVRILVDASELTVVGITEVFSKLPGILKGMGIIKKLLRSLKPELLILIDFPDFNLHLAATAKKIGIPVLYYISPQVGSNVLVDLSIIWRLYCLSSSSFTPQTMFRRLSSDTPCLTPPYQQRIRFLRPVVRGRSPSAWCRAPGIMKLPGTFRLC